MKEKMASSEERIKKVEEQINIREERVRWNR